MSIFLYARILEFVLLIIKTDDTSLSLYIYRDMLRMLRYEERLYDFLVCQKDARRNYGSLCSNSSFIITDTEAQSICNALEMDNTSSLNYLSKDEVKNLSCISADKKKMLWKLVKAVKKDRRYAPPNIGISCESIANILKDIKEI